MASIEDLVQTHGPNTTSHTPSHCEQLLNNDVNVLRLVTNAHRYLDNNGLDLALLLDFTLWGLPTCVKDPFV
jgi:hypothetical protein